MSPYIIAGLISEDSKEVYPLKLPKIAVVVNRTLIWRPRLEALPRISPLTLYFQKLESLADSMGLSSSKFVQWALKDASFLQQSAFFGLSRLFKVIQGRWFWYQSKACMRLPISRSLWLSYLAPFLRYGDLLAKNNLANFSHPTVIRRPRSLCSLWNFVLELTMRKLESWGYPPVKTPCMMVA